MIFYGSGWHFWHCEFVCWYPVPYKTKEDAERAWNKYLSLSPNDRISTWKSTYLD